MGSYKEVITDTRVLLSMAPKDTDILYFQATAEIQTGSVDDALTDLDKALDVDSNCLKCYELRGALLGAIGKFDGACKDMDVLIQLGEDTPTYFFRRGVLKACLQEWGDAILDLKRSIAFQDGSTPRRFLGRVYASMRQWMDALREYKRAIGFGGGEAELAEKALMEAVIPHHPMPMEEPAPPDDKASFKKKGFEEKDDDYLFVS